MMDGVLVQEWQIVWSISNLVASVNNARQDDNTVRVCFCDPQDMAVPADKVVTDEVLFPFLYLLLLWSEAFRLYTGQVMSAFPGWLEAMWCSHLMNSI